MQSNDSVVIDGPKTLTLSPQDLSVILDSLAERPFKVANGPICSIMAQLKEQQPKPTEEPK